MLCFAASNIYAQPCSDLFISEMIYSRDESATPPRLDCSVELYNPTDASINLGRAGYKVELFKEGDTIATAVVNLSGIVPSEEAFVDSYSYSSSGILNLSDQLHLGLNFIDKVELHLTKNGSILDVVGKQGIGNEVGTVNLDSLLNDPTYLETININLQSVEDLVVRRRAIVQEGETVFETANLIDQWWVYPNTFIDNLGEHLSACGSPIVIWKDVDHDAPEVTTTEGDEEEIMGTIRVIGALEAEIKVWFLSTFEEFDEPPVETANLNDDYDHDMFNQFEFEQTPNSNSEQTVDICEIIDDSEEEGDEGAGFLLFILDGNGTNASIGFDNTFDILIKDDDGGANSTNTLYSQSKYIEVFPTVTTGEINIKTTEPDHVLEKVVVYSAGGQVVARKQANNSPDMQLDLSTAPRGYLSVIIKSNRGFGVKQIIKQ